MPDARRTEPPARAGGVPDGVLVGLLAFLLGLAVLVWSATGLAALFTRGAWPATVTFTRTPGAVRALITQPHDIPGAWPDTDPAALSGWGLFWGLFISQLLVVLVLTIFTMGIVARTKARRTQARQQPQPQPAEPHRTHPAQMHPAQAEPHRTAPAQTHPAPAEPHRGDPERTHPALAEPHHTAPTQMHPAPTEAPQGDPAQTHPAPAPAEARPWEPAPHEARPRTQPPAPGRTSGTPPHPEPALPGRSPSHAPSAAAPAAAAHAPASAPAPNPVHAPGTGHAPPLRPSPARYTSLGDTPTPAKDAYRYGFGYAPARSTAAAPAPRLAYADPAERHRLAAQALAAAEGAALVVTSSPALWAETKDARAKLGPVLLYDPSHLCDTPARMHWNPADGCADRDTAAARAVALLSPLRPQARIDSALADTAETLLRSWLQAAALDGLPFKQLARWAQGTAAQDPVRILRTHPQAAPGSAGELESALTAHPERREQAQQLTARALSCLTSIHIREACKPNRTDSLTLASFAAEGGTLYVLGEPLEEPRTHPGAMPLLTALAADVVEHGRRMAARSSHGRLDPPLTLVLEDVAAVAPVPRLPELLEDDALPLLALCRSREQARSRWPDWPADAR
ncbi:type VI secretion protein [Streptomyces sp. W1SF4]|uniref:type VI secretion protein n=1 Tax=Streptomyces sp. W1SF4 TaxID=2305220 RepID=UPI000F6EFE0B|nr:type VI secretion protein [Streptomyces sp. W1SF4]AZM90209.1 type VI secretion protein [Streptomyces sp. W1SF4]